MTTDREQEIQGVKEGGPHLVILGAGASVAALPNGDKHGRRHPTMENFVSILDLGTALEKANLEHRGRNFEDVIQ